MQIDCDFEAGNIVVKTIAGATATLEIRKDNHCDFFQWFYFRVTGVGGLSGQDLCLSIVNASLSSYAKGWLGYKARYSYDNQQWFQETQTQFDNGVLTITHRSQEDTVWFAYFAPYLQERHRSLIARMTATAGIEHRSLGHSVNGQPLDYLQLGSQAASAKQIWLFARQHPGESMAQWWIEGALEFLVDPQSTAQHDFAAQLLSTCRFHIVPNMNPDGSRLGHLRTNALGIDLNRQWAAPSIEKSPEVFFVRQRMLETGVDFSMDVHGDETIAANFIAGFSGITKFNPEKWALFIQFRTDLTATCTDFQDQLGYPQAPAGMANMALATNYIANQFNCVAMTLEMPFKDHNANAQPIQGWNPARSKALAHASLQTLARMASQL